MSLIHVQNLVKEYKTYDRREGISGAVLDLFFRDYKTLRAVDDISFDIERGEMVGYIGANGAGKSTTIKVLCGILYPTAGEVIVDGRSPFQERETHVRNIGAVFGQRSQLWWDLAAGESLHLLSKIYGLSEKQYQQRMEEFEQVLKVKEFLKTPARKLSLGQKMRCELAASLIHNPSIIFLDEPTIGLDVTVKQSIRDFVRRINKERGVTVILTTHDLRDIEELCSRVLIIDKGKKVFDGTLEALRMKAADSAQLTFSMVHALEKDWRPDGLPGSGVLWKADGAALTAILGRQAPPRTEVIRAVLDRYGQDVQDIDIAEPQIEHVVQQIYASGTA
ncbi:MAG TPA: ATP-binding cassette domain-containing protein [Planctomycetota bacterium]|nr:ATP-binding cassette domain-containing protein [Planctomycetota bacterium]